LHASAVVLVERHDGEVPSSYDELLALPGVGPYTASAVLAFGFGRRHAVLDTNVRRVHARRFDGRADAATAAPTVRERAAALARVPDGGAARHSVAVMELGALVCTARAPRCQACPLLVECRWRAAGRPELPPRRPAQRFTGTDRQVRGRLMALLRATSEPVPATVLARVWDDDTQRDRALAGLLADGLVERLGADGYRLPA
jgi:A/G-specific adenine glycosylase